MVLAIGTDSELVVMCAVDGPCGRPGLREELADAAGVPVERLVLVPGGAGREDWRVSALAEAVVRAVAARQDAHLQLGRSSAWELVRPASVAQLLAGRRLERSRRQLVNRAADQRLEELALALNDGALPPGGPWGDRLVDARVHAVSVWSPGATAPTAVLAMVAGADAFEDGGGRQWATAGARGHAVRLLRSPKSLGDTLVHIARVASDARSLGATGRDIKARDAEEARHRSERVGAALVRSVQAAVDASSPVGLCRLRWHVGQVEEAPEDPAGDGPVRSLGVLELGSARMLWLSGRVSDALRLELSAAEPSEPGLSARDAFIPFGPVDGDLGRFQTGRECSLQAKEGEGDEGSAERGRWLRQAVTTPRLPEAELPQLPELGDGPVSPELLDLSPAPHLSVVVRMGRMDAQGVRQLTLDARWRLGDASHFIPPGQRWQVRLEWCHPADGWVPAMLGGVPVDDLHQGMRSRRFEGPGGQELRLRWSVPEPRRWKGRKLRLRVGPSMGGPLLSSAVTVS